MSSGINAIHGMINNALMQTHTAFCAKVISVSGKSAKVQPLNMVQAIGRTAKKQAVIEHVPSLEHVKDVAKGDTVYCLCAERDITETKNGKFDLPVKGRHMLSSAVIIGKF